MMQRLQLSSRGADRFSIVDDALIVSTPQDVALLDAHRGARMFSEVAVPNAMRMLFPVLLVLGIVKNMSYFSCEEPSYIFGKGGANKTSDDMGLEFVGEVFEERPWIQ
ncbi:hypothetical protein MLD38_028060 [Melastoma candidum]|uniref:Uncharacterized protein n=1 Tax=Melastoma candidum TaxID=119954 RepID=A0ACB9N0F8_9MYRT|nr:hypothetical protein MLD38_028060 [Melastoma candidum]